MSTCMKMVKWIAPLSLPASHCHTEVPSHHLGPSSAYTICASECLHPGKIASSLKSTQIPLNSITCSSSLLPQHFTSTYVTRFLQFDLCSSQLLTYMFLLQILSIWGQVSNLISFMLLEPNIVPRIFLGSQLRGKLLTLSSCSKL